MNLTALKECKGLKSENSDFCTVGATSYSLCPHLGFTKQHDTNEKYFFDEQGVLQFIAMRLSCSRTERVAPNDKCKVLKWKEQSPNDKCKAPQWKEQAPNDQRKVK